MSAVSNTSPLILYSKISRLDLLRQVFDDILVPDAVLDEVRARGIDVPEVAEILRHPWITSMNVDGSSIGEAVRPLDRGEAHALTLASRYPRQQPVLLDDRRARMIGQRLGFLVIGSGGVLLIAKRDSLIATVRPLLDDLRDVGLYLSDRVYWDLVTKAGEETP